jgi:carbon-monoxide dehydrogenase medium subunit
MLAPFELLEPATSGEAAAMLASLGDDAGVYAGGTELLLVMKEGLARYRYLINLKTAAGLADIRLSADGRWLEIGALVTHRQLARSDLVRDHAPLLAEAAATVANARVRAVGTLGGNLCFAEPHSDPATVLMAWGAEIELESADNRRSLPLDHFLTGLLETARRPDEVLTWVRLPVAAGRTASAYAKFAVHERPTATAAAVLTFDGHKIATARLAVGSLGPRPGRVAEAEAQLRGATPGEAAFRAAGEAASSAVEPDDDLYGAADYKRHLAGVLSQRALRAAAARAEEATQS